PVKTAVVPTAQTQPVMWHYTTERPGAGWMRPGFDDSGWLAGPAGFGTEGTPGAIVRTRWDTNDIWLRRTVTIPAGRYPKLRFNVYHDEDVEIYVDGIRAASESGFTTGYVFLDIKPAARAHLKPGATVTLAVHCRQTT